MVANSATIIFILHRLRLRQVYRPPELSALMFPFHYFHRSCSSQILHFSTDYFSHTHRLSEYFSVVPIGYPHDFHLFTNYSIFKILSFGIFYSLDCNFIISQLLKKVRRKSSQKKSKKIKQSFLTALY